GRDQTVERFVFLLDEPGVDGLDDIAALARTDVDHFDRLHRMWRRHSQAVFRIRTRHRWRRQETRLVVGSQADLLLAIRRRPVRLTNLDRLRRRAGGPDLPGVARPGRSPPAPR